MSNDRSIVVIIPAYNVEAYLDRCIDSVLSQDLPANQILITDDGSTDSTGTICDRYAAVYPQIVAEHRDNAGVSAARNAALKKVTSRYFVFLDADDALEKHALRSLIEEQEKSPDHFVAGDRVMIATDPDGNEKRQKRKCPVADRKVLTNDEARRFLCSGEYCLQSACHKLFETKRAAGLRFCEDITNGEDRLFVYEYLKRCNEVLFLAEGLWRIYSRDESASRRAPDRKWMGMIRVMDRLAQEETDPEICREYRRQRMDLLVLYITAYLWRGSRDRDFLRDLRGRARKELSQYKADGASSHDTTAAWMYAYLPAVLLRIYTKLKGMEI